jgi:hypothetical protein
VQRQNQSFFCDVHNLDNILGNHGSLLCRIFGKLAASPAKDKTYKSGRSVLLAGQQSDHKPDICAETKYSR